jgi:cytochrome c oxidase subunit 4
MTDASSHNPNPSVPLAAGAGAAHQPGHGEEQIHGGPYHGYQEPIVHGHGTGVGKYIAVFVALCILTAMSFWTYADFPITWPFHGEPAVGRVFMIAVSCTKAMLVILFFMHVKYEANWKYVLTIPAGMMSIFLMLMLVPDIGLRMRKASEERKLYMAQPAPPVQARDFAPPVDPALNPAAK